MSYPETLPDPRRRLSGQPMQACKSRSMCGQHVSGLEVTKQSTNTATTATKTAGSEMFGNLAASIHRLRIACPILAFVATDLATMARLQENGSLARLATDAYSIATAAHLLLEELAELAVAP